MSDREMIEQALEREMHPVESWADDPDNGVTAALQGRWRVIEDDEDAGLYAGDEGAISACVVGAEQYGNRHVSYSFHADGFDPVDLPSFDLVEAI